MQRTPLPAASALLALALAHGGAQAQAAGAEWTTPSGTLQATRYSSLAQIDTSNAGKLVEDFSFATGSKATHQGQPLVVGSTMYVVKPFPNHLVALDLANGGQ